MSAACGATVSVQLVSPHDFGKLEMDETDGLSLDRLDLDTDVYEPDPSLLSAAEDEAPVEETLVSDLLRSNCPVTGQPDWGSVQIHYVGRRSTTRACCATSSRSAITRAFTSSASSGSSSTSCTHANR